MATMSFNIDLKVENPEVLPELEQRVQNLVPVFEEVISEWAKGNQEKFEAGLGKEAVGVDVSPDVFWEALTPGYRAAKRKAGFEDQIMVRTGDLRASLIDIEGFFHEEMPLQAVFGTPKAEEDQAKAIYNFEKRPVIFLGLSDQNMIRKTVVDYFSFGEDFKEILFARGLENLQLRNEAAQLNMEFKEAMSE